MKGSERRWRRFPFSCVSLTSFWLWLRQSCLVLGPQNLSERPHWLMHEKYEAQIKSHYKKRVLVNNKSQTTKKGRTRSFSTTYISYFTPTSDISYAPGTPEMEGSNIVMYRDRGNFCEKRARERRRWSFFLFLPPPLSQITQVLV